MLKILDNLKIVQRYEIMILFLLIHFIIHSFYDFFHTYT